MFDEEKDGGQRVLCGCGSVTEAQADALVKRALQMKGIPDYFVNGVAAGLYFASLESGDMRGATFEEFVRNAHDAYISGAAEKAVEKLVGESMRGGVLEVEVRHV